MFRRLGAANLKVNADKFKFFRKELQYLGHRVTDQSSRKRAAERVLRTMIKQVSSRDAGM